MGVPRSIMLQRVKEFMFIYVFFLIATLIGLYFERDVTDFPLGRLLGATTAFALITGFYEFKIEPVIHKKIKYSMLMVTRIIYYYATYGLILVAMGYATLIFKQNIPFNEVVTYGFYDVFPNGLAKELFGLFFLVTLIVFTLQINRMLGKGFLLDYALGKYHTPRIEKRIFMFLDLKSSTTIAERLGHEKYSGFLKDFFNKLDEPILETKGKLFQYVGDEIVMIWNVKDGLKNNNCIRFYFLLQDKVNLIREKFILKYGVYPEFKAGLHYGEVSITEIGSQKKDIAYHGDVVNTTSRICLMCKKLGKDFLISEELLQLMKSRNELPYSILAAGSYKLKGKQKEVVLHSVNRLININKQKEPHVITLPYRIHN
ncbi:MAG: adenylate/guanylate cyclase domain-containing protein [Ignavibacteria bacterium]|jgi:adenylate cyclase